MFKRQNLKWILLGVLALGIFLSSGGSRSYWKRKRALRSLERKLTDLKASNANLSVEVSRLKSDPRTLERIARNELGLVKPNELEYRFVVDGSSGGRR